MNKMKITVNIKTQWLRKGIELLCHFSIPPEGKKGGKTNYTNEHEVRGKEYRCICKNDCLTIQWQT